jgi:hypothetical protein
MTNRIFNLSAGPCTLPLGVRAGPPAFPLPHPNHLGSLHIGKLAL